MTIHRFFIPDELIQGDEVFFPADMAHQIARVLRLQVGDTVLVLDGSGLERVVRLHEVAKRAAQGTVEATRPNRNEPRTHVTLCMALVKGKKMEWVLQKGTELGVSRFVPVLTDRSVIGSLDDVGDAKLDRWEAIVREAAEQSERARLPEVVEPQRFDVALGQARLARGLLLLPWEGGGNSLRPLLRPSEGPLPEALHLFIGPEGGFTADEVTTARAYGAQPVTLGPRILRAETAALAALAAIFYELGEWERDSG